MNSNLLVNFVIILNYISNIDGHSWLACVDYTEKNGATYDHNKCRGYARLAKNLAPKGGLFGQDKGFDYHPSESKPCRDNRDDALSYDSNHPMATYYAGQQVVIAHPMKNHQSDSCTNAYIPDNGNFIYRGTKNAAADPTLSEFKNHLVADLGIKDQNMPLGQFPRPGYQNAPNFCDNTDKSLGTYSFNVPSDLEPGQYTFIWLWGFNSAQDLYSGCFEVNIVGTLAERNAMLSANGFSNTYEPCGGTTSNFQIAGNTNPGCTNDNSGGTTTPATPATTVGPPPTTAPSITTTASPVGSSNLIVNDYQSSGYITLTNPEYGVVRRYLKFQWSCPGVEVKFWGAVVTKKESDSSGASYDLMQEGDDVASGKVFFHSSLGSMGCNRMSYPPIATLIRDE